MGAWIGLSAACLLAGALYLWFLGRKLAGETGGAVAGLVYALSPGVQIQPHLIKQHMVWTLCCLACFHACLLILEYGIPATDCSA